MEQESVVDGNLATEAALISLDTLEIIVKVKEALLLAFEWSYYKYHVLRHMCLFLIQ